MSLSTSTVFNFSELGSSLQTGQEYNLIDTGSGITGFNPLDFTTDGLSGLTATYSLAAGTDDLQVEFTAAGSAAVAYFNGQGADLATGANYYTTATGSTPLSSAPTSATDVFLTSNNGTTGGSANAPTLNSNLSVNSLTFTGAGTPAASGENITGSGTLTIAAGTGTYTAGTGIVAQTGAGNNTIGVAVALGASQSWTVTDATNTLTVSGQVSDGGSGYALTKSGAGVPRLERLQHLQRAARR